VVLALLGDPVVDGTDDQAELLHEELDVALDGLLQLVPLVTQRDELRHDGSD
jgi:hypothetical protein